MHQEVHSAKDVLGKLQSGDPAAWENLYHTFQPVMLQFAKHRLPNPSEAEEMVKGFWKDLAGGLISRVDEKTSTCSHLLKLLNHRIEKSKSRLKKARSLVGSSIVQNGTARKKALENALRSKDRKRLLLETMATLERLFPYDASLVWMYLGGKTFDEMARIHTGEKNGPATDISKNIEAIRERFERPRTGSMAKFAIALERCMKARGMANKDLF